MTSPSAEEEGPIVDEPAPDRTGLAIALGSLVAVAGLGTGAALIVTGRRRPQV